MYIRGESGKPNYKPTWLWRLANIKLVRKTVKAGLKITHERYRDKDLSTFSYY